MTISAVTDRSATTRRGVLTRTIGDRRWGLFFRATAVASVAGIVIVTLFPASASLVWLAVVGIPTNSPLSPLLPTAFEPVIMEAAKYSSVSSVGLVATGIYLYTEYLNWYVYSWLLNWKRFQRAAEGRWVKLGVRWFAKAPFTTVVVFAFTPLPFWAARALAILHRYPLRTFMVATAVGRLPRFWLYAWLGDVVQAPDLLLWSVVIGGALIVIAMRLAAHKRLLEDTVLDQNGNGNGDGNGSAPESGA